MGDQLAVASLPAATPAPAGPTATGPATGPGATTAAVASSVPAPAENASVAAKPDIPQSKDSDSSQPSSNPAEGNTQPATNATGDSASDPTAAAGAPAPATAGAGGGGPQAKTVFMDSSDYNVKHPLAHRWCLWFDQIQKDKEWGANLTPIASFETVEDFWGLHNNIIKASELKTDCFFHLFKDGIRPTWEDENNRAGGRFRFQMAEKSSAAPINQTWLTAMLCLIGEQLPAGDQIQGAHITHNPRAWRIELWTKGSGDSEKGILTEIGKRFKELLNTQERLQFSAHASKKGNWTI